MLFEYSAGGVVYKVENGSTFILVSQHSYHHGWVFPKGLIGDKEHLKGEDKRETAIREVKEETGAEGEIIEKLTPITYFYVMDKQKRRKTVYYYIMKYVGGDITIHDHEMEDVVWFPPEKVMEKLTYQSDKDVYKEALPKVQRLVDSV